STRRPDGGAFSFRPVATAITATVATTIVAVATVAAAIAAPIAAVSAIESIAAAFPAWTLFLDDRLRLDLLHLVPIQVRCVGDHHAQNVFRQVDVSLDRRH